ncbi:MAG: AAA family ATPase [Gammaproteobacteria bacterium]|nr:AAA family ATPase [Gammaproteobacteria bacterium]
MTNPLPPERLRRQVDPALLGFATTAELGDLRDVLGQSRATDALRFGIGMRRQGYNLFVLGPQGTGRHSIVRQFLTEQARGEPAPHDWCYVANFEQEHKPKGLALPAGVGVKFKRDLEQLIEDLGAAITAAFESDEYRARRQEIEGSLKERHEQAFTALGHEAEEQGIALIRTPTGMGFAPMQDHEVIGPEQFHKLPEPEQQRLEAAVGALQEKLEMLVRQLPQWRREVQQRIRDLDREVTQAAVEHLIDDMRRAYAVHPAVIDHLAAVQQAVVDDADGFHHGEDGPEAGIPGLAAMRPPKAALTRRFAVNLLVDHSDASGAPVVYEDNPGYQELIGRVEHIAQMGALVTDFTLIKPGALHRANGGYLMLDAHKILTQPFAWDGLKRCLSAREIRIESPGQMLSLISTVSLEPERMPLDVKVVLLGDRHLYYLLYHYDPDFRALFKVAADFEEDIPRDGDSELAYAHLVATLARRDALLPFTREAVASVIEHSARLADDSSKLSIAMQQIVDVLHEADYWARAGAGETITAGHVARALAARIDRQDRIRDRMLEQTLRGTLLIDTAGAKVGQINGLSVLGLGEFSFGHPTRLSARVRLGKGEVIDIQREVEMGGPIHSKGVLILSGLLAARYSPDQPLALTASLVFEQTYGEIEGDSASCAELYALLSAIAEIPIRQCYAVTGSVNQFGEVQAIGGVNEKIEGFFDLCARRGLTGEQGVLIPVSNVAHLMLREDVVEACRAGRFAIHPVTMIDEGMELLTGMPAGERDADGRFPPETVNGRVADRLSVMLELTRIYSAPPEPVQVEPVPPRDTQ